jgi:hypothetical protein
MSPADPSAHARGLMPEELARRYRVSPDKIRTWIKSGALRAINTADTKCAKPRFVVTPESLKEFEAARTVAPPVKPTKRRRRASGQTDFFPD